MFDARKALTNRLVELRKSHNGVSPDTLLVCNELYEVLRPVTGLPLKSFQRIPIHVGDQRFLEQSLTTLSRAGQWVLLCDVEFCITVLGVPYVVMGTPTGFSWVKDRYLAGSDEMTQERIDGFINGTWKNADE